MKPLVSVLIPCYNAERWLAQTLTSALEQSWKNLEIILVDDGSRDGSLRIAKSFQSERLKVISQENCGASVARNLAYAHAQGDYIQHLDADDFLSRVKIEAQIKLLQAVPSNYLALSGTMHFFDGTDPLKGILDDGWPLVDSDCPREWLIDLYGPEHGGMVQPGSWLTPRTITDKVGPWNVSIDPSPDNDGEYFARVVLASSGIRKCPEGIIYYRKFPNGGSMSGQRSPAYQAGAVRSLDLIQAALLAECREERALKALARRYQDTAFTAYPYAPEITKIALSRASKLGYCKYKPRFATPKGRFLSKMVGWRSTRRLQVYWHHFRHFLEGFIR
jgi:glycosyltransferase involved in cell wall biosynthesis